MKKVIRYFLIYGFARTLVKVAGRSRMNILRFFFIKLFIKRKSFISLIGCGQFGFSTISYFLLKNQGNHFLECYDPNKANQNSTANFWGFNEQDNSSELIENSNCELVYIASNHASHTKYAIEAIQCGKNVFIEKPISVSISEFKELLNAKNAGQVEVYVGYNRPFSKAIRILKENQICSSRLPVTLSCFVIGHFIEENHWYRNPTEGTRICGNLGHWIDLSIHLLNKAGKIPEIFDINISYSNTQEIDDNISVTLTTECNDLLVLVLTSRSEPFEGINETINFQSGNLSAKIDDFRRIQLWSKDTYKSYKFSPKDVGHERAINQPFSKDKRSFCEIEISTIIMLEIAEMVKIVQVSKTIRPFDVLNSLKKIIN